MNKKILIVALIWTIFLFSPSQIEATSRVSTNKLPQTMYPIGNNDQSWLKTYGRFFLMEQGESVVQTSDGGYLVLADATFIESYYTLLINVGPDGQKKWQRIFFEMDGEGIIKTSDEKYVMIGYSYKGTFSTFLMKINSEGKKEWSTTIDGFLGSWFGDRNIQQTLDGGFIIVGSTGSGDALLTKVDSTGIIEWNASYDGAESDTGSSVMQTKDGGYIIGGRTYPYGEEVTDLWILKTDSIGNEQWNKSFGDQSYEDCYSILQTDDGGYVAAGVKNYSGWILKIDASGTLIWDMVFPNDICSTVFSMDKTDDNGIIVTGIVSTSNPFDRHLSLIKLSENGSVEWIRSYGRSNHDEAGYCVRQTDDGGFIITGYKSNSWIPITILNFDIWLIKTDAMGNATRDYVL